MAQGFLPQRRARTGVLRWGATALTLLGGSGCGMTWEADAVRALPPSDAKFVIEAPCPVAAAARAVPEVAAGLELELESTPPDPAGPWLFERGARLVDPVLWYRVDVSPGSRGAETSILRVYALPKARMISDTQETIAKPAALAMGIVARCAAGGAAGGAP